MLHTRNAFNFRKFFKEEVARENGHLDLNFIGSLPPDHKIKETGFAKLIYGNRDNLGHYLATTALNVAADDQAIHELIQNADDSKSTIFNIIYNEHYLMCFNNGQSFSEESMSAIINIAGNKKGGEDIGSYGIGFKILHRLVGTNDGRDAIINDYAGPIIFSWKNFTQLEAFINGDDILVETDNVNESQNPWLVKLINTCFPTHVNENLKLQDYFSENVLFTKHELNEMRDFLKTSSQIVNLEEIEKLNQGSIFFIKLGNGKSKFLEEGIEKIKNGLIFSLNFLNHIEKVNINGEEVKKTTSLCDYKSEFQKDSDEFQIINPKNKDRSIKFSLGYYPNYKESINNLHEDKTPNLYTFFSMDEEKLGFKFLLHCNAFDMNNDRRKLQLNSQINEKLLPLIAKNIIKYVDKQKETNIDNFYSLYAAFLLSNEPKIKPNINDHFFSYIKQYIKNNIPTKTNYSNNKDNVKIKITKLDINLDDFGLNKFEWFKWSNESDTPLINEALNEEKLGLEKWDIINVLNKANLESVNNWIKNCEKETYNEFLDELERGIENHLEGDKRIDIDMKEKIKSKIRNMKIFKFSDNEIYSMMNVLTREKDCPNHFYGHWVKYKYYYKSDKIFLNNKISGLVDELGKLDIIVSGINISEYPNIFSLVRKGPEDKQIFELIAHKCNDNKLQPDEKKNIFLTLIHDETKFTKVSTKKIKELKLFLNKDNELRGLNELIGQIETPDFLNRYKINDGEYFAELEPFLITNTEILFKEIFQPNQDDILAGLTTAKEIKSLIKFYQDNQKQFFKEFIIKKTENSFLIDKKTSETYQVQSADKKARKFIDENCAANLFVLPYDFLDYKDEDCILRNNDLNSKIIDSVKVDDLQEDLIDIVSPNYVSSQIKFKFLNELSEIKLSSDHQYVQEDIAYKILKMACSVIEGNDYQDFKNKIVIEYENQKLNLSDIPPFSDKIKIGNKEFSLSRILPSTYQNSNLVSGLISLFTNEGLPGEKLNALFGVNEEHDIDDIFKKFKEQNQILENTEQFFFLIYFHQRIKQVDISKLGFDLSCAIYPSEYALDKEKLPDYLQEWIKKNEVLLPQLESVGIWTENSVIVELRKFLAGKIKHLDNKRISQEKRFYENDTALFNTFEWLKEINIEISTINQFATFKKIVEVINESRSNGYLKIEKEFNYHNLEEESNDWKIAGDFTIYEYKGKMPQLVKLDEIDDFIFYRYTDNDFAIKENKIYLNSKEDKKKLLQKIATDDKNNFSFEDLWQLFGEYTDETEKLKQENSILKNQLQLANNATLGTGITTDISQNDQQEANREAKEIVKHRLEKEGFIFENGLGENSTIDGVTKDGYEFPLVVKSYIYHEEPLKIGANEWIQLIQPNSMFWLYFGNGRLGCLKLYDLLRNQDRLTISFSTENLDKEELLGEFANLLRYFKDVHFDFNTVLPNNIADNLNDYRFDERKSEEDLSSDNENLL